MTPLEDAIDAFPELRDFILDARDDDERRHAASRVIRRRALENGGMPDLGSESVEAMVHVLYGADAAAGHGPMAAADSVRDTAVVLADVDAFIQRFIVLRDEHQAAALALYVLHTHALAAAETTPYLAVLGAEKRSGKSRLLELLARLCTR